MNRDTGESRITTALEPRPCARARILMTWRTIRLLLCCRVSLSQREDSETEESLPSPLLVSMSIWETSWSESLSLTPNTKDLAFYFTVYSCVTRLALEWEGLKPLYTTNGINKGSCNIFVPYCLVSFFVLENYFDIITTRRLVHHYGDFINQPFHLLRSKQVSRGMDGREEDFFFCRGWVRHQSLAS